MEFKHNKQIENQKIDELANEDADQTLAVACPKPQKTRSFLGWC